TVEFVMDDAANAYVIEVNTRIQVEHPVSEMICGVDLIAIQINTALEGELPLTQEDIDYNGHAMEVRVCAEDPVTGFTPQQGTIEHLNFPDGPGTRVDSHLEVGTWISPYYDSMIGKIISWHSDREKCIDRMLRCLDENEMKGVKTTIPLFRWLLNEENFRAGDFHTGFLDNTDWQDQLREQS
ncbi:MAG: acetyl-CoA carboxylase biotin carboxylase subunit, partial [bacterium]